MPQANTAICCFFGSDIRGTFNARAIVAKERVPSTELSVFKTLQKERLDIWLRLTHCGHDLCLQAKLVGETSSKVVDSALPVTRNVWHFPYVIKHMTTCEEQYNDEASCSPEISVLNDGEYVG